MSAALEKPAGMAEALIGTLTAGAAVLAAAIKQGDGSCLSEGARLILDRAIEDASTLAEALDTIIRAEQVPL